MNKVYLLKYCRGKFKHYSDLWNETGEEKYMREALNYQEQIEKLEAEKDKPCDQDCIKYGECVHKFLKKEGNQ